MSVAIVGHMPKACNSSLTVAAQQTRQGISVVVKRGKHQVPGLLEMAQAGPFYSIDVECIATGTGHHDRAVAQISLVDQYENVS